MIIIAFLVFDTGYVRNATFLRYIRCCMLKKVLQVSILEVYTIQDSRLKDLMNISAFCHPSPFSQLLVINGGALIR